MNNQSRLETIDYKPPTLNLPTNNPPKPSGDNMTMDSSADHSQRGASSYYSGSTNTHNHHSNHHHDDMDDDDDEEEEHNYDLYSEEKEWDEGGKSHCGYSEFVHNTLMSVGGAVHKVVGEPSPKVERELKAVGNWFQEASYAARDLFSSKNGKGQDEDGEEGEGTGMTEDAWDAVKTLVRGGSGSKQQQQQPQQTDHDQENMHPIAVGTSAGTTAANPIVMTN